MTQRIPTLCRHRSAKGDRAYVELSGRRVYVGPWGTKAAKAEYDRQIALWLASGRTLPKSGSDLTVAELIVRYVQHAEGYYRKGDSPTTMVGNIVLSMRPLRALFGKEPAADFGPVKLKVVRQAMIDPPPGMEGRRRVRSQINKSVKIIVRMFKWAAENELLPGSLWQDLRAVDGLKRGRSDAKESKPVGPVLNSVVEATLPHLSPVVAAMVQLQRRTGMRPGEVCQLTAANIDRVTKPWVYRPTRHKTEHHGRERPIVFGPRCRSILTPFLEKSNDPNAPLFSPAESLAYFRSKRTAKRDPRWKWGTKPGDNVVKNPKRKPGVAFTVASYGRSIALACEKAFGFPAEFKDRRGKAKAEETPEQRRERRARAAAWRLVHCWEPNRLRHASLTDFRNDPEGGLDIARLAAGHSNTNMTEHYAKEELAKLMAYMEQKG